MQFCGGKLKHRGDLLFTVYKYNLVTQKLDIRPNNDLQPTFQLHHSYIARKSFGLPFLCVFISFLFRLYLPRSFPVSASLSAQGRGLGGARLAWWCLTLSVTGHARPALIHETLPLSRATLPPTEPCHTLLSHATPLLSPIKSYWATPP